MTYKDARLFALLSAVLAALLAPALLSPASSLANFGDLYSYHHPLRHLAASRLQEGQLPFWNPYIFSGLPLAANPQAALFYPPSVLFDCLPVAWAFTLHAALHLALGALGAQLLLRDCGLDSGSSFALAAAFALSPFLVYRIPQGIPTHLAALAWVPWCWLALRARRPLWLAGIWALQFLSGHPQFLAVNALGMALWAARRRALLPTLALGAAGAAALTAVQLGPSSEFLSLSNRGGLPEAFREAYSLPWSGLARLLSPALGGVPGAGYGSVPSTFFEMHALYLGLVPLALAAAALAGGLRGRAPADARLGAALAAFGLFFALGSNNPLASWAGEAPLVGFSRVPARFALLVFWGLWLAAAAGAAGARAALRGRPRVKAALAALVLIDLGAWAAAFVRAEPARRFLEPRPDVVAALAGRSLRFLTAPELDNPNKAMLYRAMNVNGYEAFYLRGYAEYAAASEGRPAADPSRTRFRDPSTAQMRRLSVGYALGADGRLSRLPGAAPFFALEPDGVRRPAARMDRAELWRVGGIASERGGRLSFGVPYYPGWRAFSYGREIPVSREGLLQAVDLPPGRFWALFRFEPVGWAWLAAWTALAWAAWMAAALRRAA